MSDLINKQDVLKLIENAPYDWSNITERTEMLREIKALPSADRPKGKWIKSEFQNEEDVQNDNYLYNCSECGHGDLHAKGRIVPYCWWCGAMMKGTDDE